MSVCCQRTRQAARQIVQQYFDSFNQEQFEQTAALFSETGQLVAPFEEATVGPTNIRQFLENKARDMSASPRQWSFYSEAGNQWRVEVVGKVKALVFQVNVCWLFVVGNDGKLASARVKLIASPAELLNLRSAAST